MKAVEIVWKDITSSSGWHSQNAIDRIVTNDNDGICKQIGYVYEEDEKQLVLVDSEINVDGQKQYGTIHKIPKGVIVSQKVLSK